MQEPKEMCKFLLAGEAEKEASTRRSTDLDHELRPDEDLVLQMLDSGELEHIVDTKNKAYGHGKRIHSLSLESRAIARVVKDELEQYFASD